MKGLVNLRTARMTLYRRDTGTAADSNLPSLHHIVGDSNIKACGDGDVSMYRVWHLFQRQRRVVLRLITTLGRAAVESKDATRVPSTTATVFDEVMRMVKGAGKARDAHCAPCIDRPDMRHLSLCRFLIEVIKTFGASDRELFLAGCEAVVRLGRACEGCKRKMGTPDAFASILHAMEVQASDADVQDR